MAGLQSPALVRAFATVPRERFVGPGPWLIMKAPNRTDYVETPDADPRHVYQNALIALDPERRLNNGEPVALAIWLEQLALQPGDRFLHVGCGVGYYTAVAGEAIAPDGQAVGLELDPKLAARARDNLSDYERVEVYMSDGSQAGHGEFDAILINAGATDVQSEWLDALRPGGRLLVPLTVGVPETHLGLGQMLRLERRAESYAARFVSMAGIFHCHGARSADGDARLQTAFASGDPGEVRGLRRDAHAPEPACWLHAPGFCLSRAEP